MLQPTSGTTSELCFIIYYYLTDYLCQPPPALVCHLVSMSSAVTNPTPPPPHPLPTAFGEILSPGRCLGLYVGLLPAISIHAFSCPSPVSIFLLSLLQCLFQCGPERFCCNPLPSSCPSIPTSTFISGFPCANLQE